MGTVLAVEAEPKNAELLGKVFKDHALHARDVRVLHAVATGPSARATSFVQIMNEVGMEIARPVEE